MILEPNYTIKDCHRGRIIPFCEGAAFGNYGIIFPVKQFKKKQI